MKRNAEPIMVIMCLVLVGGCVAGASIFGVTVDLAGGRIYNPQAEAQATRTAQLAEDEAAAREIERQAQQAEADAAMAARPAMTARRSMVEMALGGGALVLVIGGAFALVAWLNKRATAVYPNSAGMYPVIVKRAWNGVTIVHDPNRALGPTTIYTSPSLVGRLLKLLPEARAEFPLPGNESTLAQLATQAQAVGLMAAVTRPGTPQASTEEKVKMVTAVTGGTPQLAPPMPDVHVIDDPIKIGQFEQLVLEAGNGG